MPRLDIGGRAKNDRRNLETRGRFSGKPSCTLASTLNSRVRTSQLQRCSSALAPTLRSAHGVRAQAASSAEREGSPPSGATSMPSSRAGHDRPSRASAPPAKSSDGPSLESGTLALEAASLPAPSRPRSVPQARFASSGMTSSRLDFTRARQRPCWAHQKRTRRPQVLGAASVLFIDPGPRRWVTLSARARSSVPPRLREACGAGRASGRSWEHRARVRGAAGTEHGVPPPHLARPCLRREGSDRSPASTPPRARHRLPNPSRPVPARA